MRPLARLLATLGAAGAVILCVPAAPAAAHPLGNFTINVAAAITVVPGEIRVQHVVDMAEIPTFQELRVIDADGDGDPSPGELRRWARVSAARAAPMLQLELDGRAVPLRPVTAGAELRPGQGGLRTLRLEASFQAAVPDRGRIAFRDGTYEGRVGWREVSAIGRDGRAVTRSSVPAASSTALLTAYPDDLLQSPLDVRRASFSYGPGVQRSSAAAAPVAGRPDDPGGPLAGLVSRSDLSPGVILISLLVAAGFGAAHALAPGHGKTVTAAYLVGAGAKMRQALGAGLAVAAMHTGSVLALGLLVVGAERAFPAERIYPVVTAAAGAAAVALGISLLVRRVRGRSRHGHPHAEHAPLSRRGLVGLAAAGGLLPSPTAVLVLVAAVALGRATFGLAIVAAFGLGLAAALAAVAMAAVRLRDAVGRRLPERVAATVPLVSAAVIVVAGSIVAGGGLAAL